MPALGRRGWTLLAFAILGTLELRAADEPRVLSWGDQGDGTYRNPVLKADYSDPDVIRVGDDFYLVASDFHYVGMQVLHSRDLVNWEVVGQVFSRLGLHPKYDEMNAYAEGTWAPTIRHHDGRFHVYVCTPYDGLFMWHAGDPRGPWSEAVTVRAAWGWEDPAPFWDDDGRAYLVHSVLGAGPLILHRMSPDGRVLLDDGTEIYRGPVAEGPKLFKRGRYDSGSSFGWAGVRMAAGTRSVVWEGGEGPATTGHDLWLRGRYRGDRARLEYSLDGVRYVDAGVEFPLRFGHWKGARFGIFSHGRGGHVDVDYVRYRYGDQE